MLRSNRTGCSQHTRTHLNNHRTLVIQCQASKTTSSRSNTTSSRSNTTSSREGTTSTKQQPYPTSRQPDVTRSKSVRESLNDVRQRLGDYLSFLVPKQEGDVGDVLMMSLSMAVLIYLSMQLYRLYAYAYFHAGQYQTMVDMMQ